MSTYWNAQQPVPQPYQPATPRPNGLLISGLAVTAVSAVLFLIGLFVPFLGDDDFSAHYWEFADEGSKLVYPLVMLFLALIVAGLVVAAFLMRTKKTGKLLATVATGVSALLFIFVILAIFVLKYGQGEFSSKISDIISDPFLGEIGYKFGMYLMMTALIGLVVGTVLAMIGAGKSVLPVPLGFANYPQGYGHPGYGQPQYGQRPQAPQAPRPQGPPAQSGQQPNPLWQPQQWHNNPSGMPNGMGVPQPGQPQQGRPQPQIPGQSPQWPYQQQSPQQPTQNQPPQNPQSHQGQPNA